MCIKKNKACSVLIKLPVLLMYLLFLSVQVFFNLDIAPHPPVISQSTGLYQAGGIPDSHPGTIKVDKSHNGSAIRLNKRFEPSPAIAFTELETLTIVSYPVHFISPLFDAGHYVSVNLHKHTLRGPPVAVVC